MFVSAIINHNEKLKESDYIGMPLDIGFGDETVGKVTSAKIKGDVVEVVMSVDTQTYSMIAEAIEEKNQETIDVIK